MSVLEAAQTGDEVVALEALRDALAAAVDECGPNMVAQVSSQLSAVLRRLAELRPGGKVTLNDALAERRAARDGAPVVAASAPRSRKSVS